MLQRTLTSVLLFSLTFTAQAGKFITEACASDSECTSACCGFNSGKCAGPVIAQERDGGCGHGNAQPNDNAAVAFLNGMSAQASQASSGTTLAVVATSAAPAAASSGGFFITHACTSDSQCAEGCCGFRSGLCAGPVVAQQRDGGCGFGNAAPNADAARILGFTGAVGNGNAASQAVSGTIVATSAAPAAASSGGFFITHACTSDSQCAEGCCGFRSGLCAGPVVAQQRDGGCGFGNAAPNADAARKLGFTGPVGNGNGNAASQVVSGTTVASGTIVVSGTTVASGTIVVSGTTAAMVATSAAPAAAASGSFFITHACTSDSECAEGCCGFISGLCAGPVIAQQRDGGCGFGDGVPNANAARLLGFTGPVGR